MVFIMIEIKKWNQKPWVQWPWIMLSSPFYRSVIQKAWTARWAWNWNFSESQNKRMLVLCKHAYLFDSIRVQRTLRADLNAPFWVPRFFEFPVFSPTHYQRLRHLKYKHPPCLDQNKLTIFLTIALKRLNIFLFMPGDKYLCTMLI